MPALLLLAVMAFVASPAWAGHVITWSVGTDCQADRLEVEASGPTTFSVCVEFDGSPMSGWPMTIQVVAADGSSQEFEIETDQNGQATFDVVIGKGQTQIVLCDADGCLYGQATITSPPPTTSTSSSSTTSTSSSTTSTSTAASTSTMAPGPGTAPASGGGFAGQWIMWLGLIISLIGIIWWVFAWWWGPGEGYGPGVVGGLESPPGTGEGDDETTSAETDTSTDTRTSVDTSTDTRTSVDTSTDTRTRRDAATSTGTGTDTATGDLGDFSAGRDGTTYFGDREPPRRNCLPLHIECERLRTIATELAVEATRLEGRAERIAAECERARRRITDIQARIADLEQRPDAVQWFTRMAWLGRDLRQAQSVATRACDQVESARADARRARSNADEAQAAADAACARAEECEAGS